MNDAIESSILDDPVWEYVLVTKLQPYIPAVKRWWETYEQQTVLSTGVTDIKYDDIECPPGLMCRMTNTPVRSPIKNVQSFPFVPAMYLQITGVQGGVARMIERVCHNNIEIDGIRIIEKHNLPSTYQKGQLLCFVPTEVLEGSRALGKYVYLTVNELCSIAGGKLPNTVKNKCHQYINSLANND